MKPVRAWVLVAAFVLALSVGRVGLAEARYSVLNLGSFGSSNTYATAINDSGQVAGFSLYSPGYFHAFRTAPNSPINPATDDLGTLGGAWSYGYGMNNLGQVVGEAAGFGNIPEQTFRTGPNLGINPLTDNIGAASGRNGQVFDVNNLGEAAGEMWTLGGASRGFRTGPNLPINPATDDIGQLRQTSTEVVVKAVNDLGQVVGFERLSNSSSPLSFRTGPHAKINSATDNLGSLGAEETFANAINNLGQVAGGSTRSGRLHAFRTAPNRPINPATDDLGTLGGNANGLGINDFGIVVGATESTSGMPIAFVHDGTRMLDLNRLLDGSGADWYLAIATGINSRGHIVGQGSFGGETMSFLLTPVPEPAGALFAACVGAWTLLRRSARAGRRHHLL